MTKLWVQCGTADEFNDMGPETDRVQTLDNAGLYLANCGAVPSLIPVAGHAVIDDGEFRGLNSIHIYWGGRTAEPIKELSIGELAEITIVLAHYGKYKLPY